MQRALQETRALYHLLGRIMLSIKLTIDMTSAASNAVPNPSTLNPPTIQAVKRIIRALMTKVNSPRVRILSGRVSRIRIGRKKAFRNPITRAARSNTHPLTIVMPDINQAATARESAHMNHLIKSLVMLLF
jgi:hypothetical protein